MPMLMTVCLYFFLFFLHFSFGFELWDIRQQDRFGSCRWDNEASMRRNDVAMPPSLAIFSEQALSEPLHFYLLLFFSSFILSSVHVMVEDQL